MITHCCAECEEQFIIVDGVAHHITSDEEVDYDRDADHVPYLTDEDVCVVAPGIIEPTIGSDTTGVAADIITNALLDKGRV